MAERRIGLIMNGVTGRMGMNQHLIRSVAAIRADGGVKLANGDTIMPDPVIVGRNRAKLEALAKARGKTEFLSACAELEAELLRLREIQTPRLRNLL